MQIVKNRPMMNFYVMYTCTVLLLLLVLCYCTYWKYTDHIPVHCNFDNKFTGLEFYLAGKTQIQYALCKMKFLVVALECAAFTVYNSGARALQAQAANLSAFISTLLKSLP